MNTYNSRTGSGTHTELQKKTEEQKDRKWRPRNDWPWMKSPHRDCHPSAENKSKEIVRTGLRTGN